MEVGLVYRATAFRKKRLKLPRESVRQLKEISYLSSVKRWEYAGGIEYKAFRFSEPTYRTSKQRGSVEQKDLDDIWHSNITYHITHIQDTVVASRSRLLRKYSQHFQVMRILKRI